MIHHFNSVAPTNKRPAVAARIIIIHTELLREEEEEEKEERRRQQREENFFFLSSGVCGAEPPALDVKVISTNLPGHREPRNDTATYFFFFSTPIEFIFTFFFIFRFVLAVGNATSNYRRSLAVQRPYCSLHNGAQPKNKKLKSQRNWIFITSKCWCRSCSWYRRRSVHHKTRFCTQHWDNLPSGVHVHLAQINYTCIASFPAFDSIICVTHWQVHTLHFVQSRTWDSSSLAAIRWQERPEEDGNRQRWSERENFGNSLDKQPRNSNEDKGNKVNINKIKWIYI